MATIKQKLTASKLVENGGNMGQAMREAGYSPATAKTPQKLTESRGWASLMKEFLPDTDLLKTHRGLLESYKLESYQFPKEEDDEAIKQIIRKIPGWKVIMIEQTEKNKVCIIAVPDNLARKGALELAYKATNKFTPEDEDKTGVNARLEAALDRMAKFLR